MKLPKQMHFFDELDGTAYCERRNVYNPLPAFARRLVRKGYSEPTARLLAEQAGSSHER